MNPWNRNLHTTAGLRAIASRCTKIVAVLTQNPCVTAANGHWLVREAGWRAKIRAELKRRRKEALRRS